MKYLILSQPSEAYAAAMSAALWDLSRPASVRSEKDTAMYCGWVVHPATSAVALALPEGDTQPVHPQADVAAFVEALGDTVTQDEANAIAAIIEGRKGQRISILQIISASPSLEPNLKDETEMEADGWFPEPEL